MKILLNILAFLASSQFAIHAGISPDDYGAIPNDTLCDYTAICQAVDSINNAGKGILRFSEGIYLIDTFKITGGVDKNDINDIVFRNCDSLTILGYNTTLSLKGDFNRSSDYQVGDYWYSYKVSVCPFKMDTCSNFKILGIEIDGNVDQMTRAVSTVSTSVAGIITKSCRNYVIQDVEVHHFHTDGIMLGISNETADTGVVLNNVSSHHHARDALTIIQLRYGTIKNCTFTFAGNTGGSYAKHSPAAGTNIEVYWDPDFKTGRITFDSCTYEDNYLAFICAAESDSITICNSNLTNTSTNTSYYMLFSPKDGIIKNCSLDTKGGYCFLNYGDKDSCNVLVDSSFIFSSYYGFVVHGDNGTVEIYNSSFIGKHNTTFTGGFPRVFGSNTIFNKNYLWYNASMHDGVTWSTCCYLKNIYEAHDNSFETDLNITGGKYFYRAYGTTDVENEIFLSDGFE